jgi:hypothetical protein
MKTVFAASAAVLALSVVTLPGTVLAQSAGAAATLPNSFDRPGGAPAQRAQASPTPSGPALTVGDPLKAAAAEVSLRKTIVAFQAGAPNYHDMSPDLAEKVQALAPNLGPIFQHLGALGSISYIGSESGADLFAVDFANGKTQWLIGLSPEGKIVALLFRPTPADGA